ncbi:MAG TPA: HAD family hydrolase [Acidimicrobiales bacterium]|nr:HAD family hydrolase [Acidimicrobiales bacterium]
MVTAAGVVALGAAAAGRRAMACAAGAAWLAGTAEFAARRIVPGPRTRGEVAAMVATSAVLPVAAVVHAARGWARVPSQLRPGGPVPQPALRRPAAVLFDRDGTLIEDVPYNGDPDRVTPLPGAREALARLRRLGIPTAVISNQSGVARGYVTMEQVAAVNRRVEDLLGPLGPWEVCPHAPEDGCGCRKPAPGLVHRAAARLRVRPEDVVVIGDIGSDVDAAEACGATAVLVPTDRTRADERARARHIASSLPGALDLVLGRGGPA